MSDSQIDAYVLQHAITVSGNTVIAIDSVDTITLQKLTATSLHTSDILLF